MLDTFLRTRSRTGRLAVRTRVDLMRLTCAVAGNLGHRLGIARRQSNLAAGAGQHLARDGAKRTRGTGDQRHLARDIEHEERIVEDMAYSGRPAFGIRDHNKHLADVVRCVLDPAHLPGRHGATVHAPRLRVSPSHSMVISPSSTT